MDNLYDKIKNGKETIRKYAPQVLAIPKYITENLKYEFFDWQKEAFENLLIYENDHKKTLTHLMFNMATGTGKTLLMASAILYYYKQGYRHFIFFVNQNNIIDKTENNFIESTHNKYLFKEKIIIDDKTIDIKKVETFSSNTQDIEIKFTSIQQLYNDIHIERENRVYLEDLIEDDIVMLADEAHHLNADTKSKNGQEYLKNLQIKLTDKTSDAEIEKKGWEHTVLELIWNKKGTAKNNRNVLLEFTATIPDNLNVFEKYSNKIIYEFKLKDFLSAGYTKEINLISSSYDKKDRILHALIFQWYRHQIALKYNIANFKPVILFRSKTIEESKADYREFIDLTSSLQISDFDFLTEIKTKIDEAKIPSLFEQGRSRTEQVIVYINKENLSIPQIIEFIKHSFKERNCIITNSKTNQTKSEKTDEDQEKLLNSLEDKNNHIRAIFTVQRLTEGWDVLNLFDIVRLYEGRDEGKDTKGNRKAGTSTIAEKQLIGRGVRYFPFDYEDKSRNKRKFDEDIKNELRVLEELYFYSSSDSKYIDELKRELKKDGYIRDDKIIKTFKLKKEFLENDFYREVRIFHNEQSDNPFRKKKTLEDIKKDLHLHFRIKGFEINEVEIDFGMTEDTERLKVSEKDLRTIYSQLKDFDRHIFNKAINIKANADNSLFQFHKLKEELEIDSIEDLLKDEFLGNINIEMVINQDFDDIPNKVKLDVLLKSIDKIFNELKGILNPKIGTEFKAGKFSDFFGEEKTKSIKKDEDSERIERELKNNNWYVLDSFDGTSEEKELIEFIKNTIGNLKDKYADVYLLRNEEVYKIYDFKKGRGFQPDFILFLRGKTDLYYQVFIEPKAQYLLEYDAWKNDFLKEITVRYGGQNILKFETKKYNLIGLPLFNKNNNEEFKIEYDKLMEGFTAPIEK
jgi:type III restriction enzyme